MTEVYIAEDAKTCPLTIVMLSGWSGAGKDAAATLMAEEMGFRRFAFADAVKQECSALYGLPLERFYHGKDRPLESPHPFWPTARTPRDILLLHAADARAKDDTLFARMVAHDIQDSEHKRIVISDWRYHVEMDTLRTHLPDARIVTVRIYRTGIPYNPHPSEHELDGFVADVTILNDGSISDLRDSLKTRLRRFLTPK